MFAVHMVKKTDTRKKPTDSLGKPYDFWTDLTHDPAEAIASATLYAETSAAELIEVVRFEPVETIFSGKAK